MLTLHIFGRATPPQGGTCDEPGPRVWHGHPFLLLTTVVFIDKI